MYVIIYSVYNSIHQIFFYHLKVKTAYFQVRATTTAEILIIIMVAHGAMLTLAELNRLTAIYLNAVSDTCYTKQGRVKG